MYRQIVLAFLTWFLGVSFVAGQGRLANLPSSPAEAGASCSRVGEVLGRNVFAQTFLLKLDDGQMETVPFSRWTEFLKIISPNSRSRNAREIEPTDIRPEIGSVCCSILAKPLPGLSSSWNQSEHWSREPQRGGTKRRAIGCWIGC